MDYIINEQVLDKLQLLDSMTYNHCVRTKEIAKEIESKFQMKSNLLSQAALIHDIGKIYVSSKILDKPGRLSPLERQIIDMHAYYGYQILQEINTEHGKIKSDEIISQDICNLVLFHHGLNPPLLTNIQISISPEIKKYACILHTIDAFEALTTDRAYRRGFTQKKAVEIMDKESSHDRQVLDFLHSHQFYNNGTNY